jgi:hypothetical protein
VLTIPALTSRKSGDDMNKAASTIKETLDRARAYAQANNTYAWVGFYEEDGSVPSANPPTPGTGRLVMSVVASKDGTIIYDPSATGTNNPIDPTRLTQVANLVKIDNVHLPLLAMGTGTGDTLDARPSPSPDPVVIYNACRFGELNAAPPNTAPYDTTNNGVTKFPFQYPVGGPAPAAQYTFNRTMRFAPSGENRINSTYDVRRIVEIGLIQTHANITPVPASGGGTSLVSYNGNVIAIQIGGFNGDVKVYRR